VATGTGRLTPSSFAVTVYAASRRSVPPHYAAIARDLGAGVAERGWVLVYGGANVGLMGECANAALAAGGRVEGVILDSFARVAHHGLHELEYAQDMRSRKAALARRGDAFVALPGAFGTLEEVSEILVERQLDHHRKPLVLVDVDGFWDPLLAQFRRMADDGLLRREYLDIVQCAEDAKSALALVESGAGSPSPHSTDKWS